jgi:predicted amidohydrolase
MGWEDSHLHVFELGDARYGFPDKELGSTTTVDAPSATC